jgi:hypothetical protein
MQAGKSRVRYPLKSLDFALDLFLFQPHYSRDVYSVSNRNEYQKIFWGGNDRAMRKADNLTGIREPIV